MRSENAPLVAWWSGGISSALACKIAIGHNPNVRVIFIDTKNEHDDTYEFLKRCEEWYSQKIETIASEQYSTIQEVWRRYKSLNVATGAICSTDLKRKVRERWQKDNDYSGQVFGFDAGEMKRAKGMLLNYPQINPLFPLIEHRITKRRAIQIIGKAGIPIPRMYTMGFSNNNCFKTGCVQGGAGYWQKIQREFPEKFEAMASMEHELTEARGEPVTILYDRKAQCPIFLLPHQNYPDARHLGTVKGREPKPLLECNGFCGANDFEADLFDDINLPPWIAEADNDNFPNSTPE